MDESKNKTPDMESYSEPVLESDLDPDLKVNEAMQDYKHVDLNKLYTYSDYLEWDDDERWELIDGVPYLMSAPNRYHQKISGNLFLQLATYLKGKSCEVYYAPFDVRLNADTLDNTVVQPDLIVVCDQSILNKAGCAGVPDLVIEILSPSTSRYDRITKFNAYRKVGVREFWIIDPVTKTLAIHILDEGDYIIHAYSDEDTVAVHVLESCNINLAEVFEE